VKHVDRRTEDGGRRTEDVSKVCNAVTSMGHTQTVESLRSVELFIALNCTRTLGTCELYATKEFHSGVEFSEQTVNPGAERSSLQH
jgi:hypothetical protein